MGLKTNPFTVSFLRDCAALETIQNTRPKLENSQETLPISDQIADDSGCGLPAASVEPNRPPDAILHVAIDVHIFVYIATAITNRSTSLQHLEKRGITLHPSSQKMDKSSNVADYRYAAIIAKEVSQSIRMHTTMIRQRLGLPAKNTQIIWYLALDGVAPLAKDNEKQRRRRNRPYNPIVDCAETKILFTALLVQELESNTLLTCSAANGKRKRNSRSRLDCVTNPAVVKEVRLKKYTVLISPHTEPGEGEYKCFRYCAQVNATYCSSAAETRILPKTVVCSRDSDMFVYALCAPDEMVANGENYLYYLDPRQRNTVINYNNPLERHKTLLRYSCLFEGLGIKGMPYILRSHFAKGLVGLCGNDYVPPLCLNTANIRQVLGLLVKWSLNAKTHQSPIVDREPSIWKLLAACGRNRLLRKVVRPTRKQPKTVGCNSSNHITVSELTPDLASLLAASESTKMHAFILWHSFLSQIIHYFESAFFVTPATYETPFMTVVPPSDSDVLVVTACQRNEDIIKLCSSIELAQHVRLSGEIVGYHATL